MPNRVSFEQPTYSGLYRVTSHLRQVDRDECYATRFHDDPSELAREIDRLVPVSVSWLVCNNREPVASLGAALTWPGHWTAWAFGTSQWPKVVLAMTKHIKRVMIPMLLEIGAHTVAAYAHAAHVEACKWLEFLGAAPTSYPTGARTASTSSSIAGSVRRPMAKKNNKKGGLNGLPSDKGKDVRPATGGGGRPGQQSQTGGLGKHAKPDKDRNTKDRQGDRAGNKPIKQPDKPKPKPKNTGGGGGGGGDINQQMFDWQKKEAADARKEENKRQEKIRKGTRLINKQFKQFDEGYYDTREAAYKGFYQPQITSDFEKARDAMTFALARAGTSASSVAQTKHSEIETNRNRNTALLNTKAAADRAETQARIADEKSALIAQLNSTAAAKQVGNEATARTAQLASAGPDYQGFGDVFYGAAQGVGAVGQAVQNAQFANTFNNGGPSSPRGVNLTGATTVY